MNSKVVGAHKNMWEQRMTAIKTDDNYCAFLARFDIRLVLSIDRSKANRILCVYSRIIMNYL